MNNISVGLRLGTMLLDHILICFIGLPPVIIYQFQTFHNSSNLTMSPYLMMPLFVIYFCKDCIGGRSLAKRILKLVVVDNTTNLPATPFQTLIRNLFCLIWPIEVFVSLFNQQRRIGDRLAGTKLSYYRREDMPHQINWLQLAVTILIAIVFTYLLLKLFYPL